MLSDADDDLYHVAGDPGLAEALMRPREAASAAAVARSLRAEILAGAYDEAGKVPSRVELATKRRVSPETASVALRMLAAEGWVTLDQGRGTFLRPRRAFRVDVTVTREEPMKGEPTEISEAVRAAAVAAGEAEPAAVEAGASADLTRAHFSTVVQAVSPAAAMSIAEGLMESMREPWSWKGWDLAGASVSAVPA